MESIFDPAVTDTQIHRLQALRPDSRPQWGKMNVGQMLAHCCVPYEMVYQTIHPTGRTPLSASS